MTLSRTSNGRESGCGNQMGALNSVLTADLSRGVAAETHTQTIWQGQTWMGSSVNHVVEVWQCPRRMQRFIVFAQIEIGHPAGFACNCDNAVDIAFVSTLAMSGVSPRAPRGVAVGTNLVSINHGTPRCEWAYAGTEAAVPLV